MFDFGDRVTVENFGPVVFEVVDEYDGEVEVYSKASNTYKWVKLENVRLV